MQHIDHRPNVWMRCALARADTLASLSNNTIETGGATHFSRFLLTHLMPNDFNRLVHRD